MFKYKRRFFEKAELLENISTNKKLVMTNGLDFVMCIEIIQGQER